jgi:hypothetical protein
MNVKPIEPRRGSQYKPRGPPVGRFYSRPPANLHPESRPRIPANDLAGLRAPKEEARRTTDEGVRTRPRRESERNQAGGPKSEAILPESRTSFSKSYRPAKPSEPGGPPPRSPTIFAFIEAPPTEPPANTPPAALHPECRPRPPTKSHNLHCRPTRRMIRVCWIFPQHSNRSAPPPDSDGPTH